MRKFMLSVAIMFGAFAASAQNPSVAVEIQNRTDCDMYVQLLAVNSSCNEYIITVVIPANSPVISPAPVAGYWYEVASVTESIPSSALCYNERVQVPWALCVSGYNNSETDIACCGGGTTTTASWVATASTPAAPVFIIYD